jgi:iron complex outermembrane receptor protein
MKKQLTGSCLVSSMALVVALSAMPALAQTKAAPDQPAASGAAPTEGEIVVTGLKRSTALVDTPVSVAVYDAIKLQAAGITQPTDFLTQTSNVNFTLGVNPGDLLISMRGQSTVRNAEPTVAMIIDGAAVGLPAEFNAAMFDVEQVEVFKGPQGAYYGRNASAGAIVITTKKPTEEFSGSAFFSYGRNNSYNAQASVSGALTKDGALRARLSGSFKGTDGSYTNVVTGEKSQRYAEQSGRLRMTYDNGGPLTLDARVTGIFGQGGSHYYSAKIQAVPGLSPNGTVVGGVPVNDISANSNLAVPYVTDVPGRYRRKVISATVKADYDLGGAVITSITNYSWGHEDFTGKNYPYFSVSDGSTNYGGWGAIFGDKTQGSRLQNKQFGQELRITSTGKHFLEWQAGFQYTQFVRQLSLFNTLNGAVPSSLTGTALYGYNGYSMVNGVMTRTLIGGGVPAPYPLGIYGLGTPYPTTNYQDDQHHAWNYAPYANVKMNFTDRLSLQLAARYDIEKRRTGSIGPAYTNPFTGLSYNPCIVITGQTEAQCNEGNSKTFRQLQPKVTLSYSLNGKGSVYASWGRSFKSGGFNPIGTREQTVQGFTAQNIVLGMSPADARAAAEKSVITQDYYNKEVSTTYEVGFKAELFNRRLYVNGAAFWTDIRNGQLYVFDPIVYVQSIQSIDKERVKGFEVDANFKVTGGLSVFGSYGLIDAKIRELIASPSAVGNRPPYVSHDTLSLGAQLNQPITEDKSVLARVEYNRTGATFYSINNDPNYERTPYAVVNARLGLSTERWDASLWGRNIFNKRYVNEIAPITAGVSTAYSLAELATYGVEMRVRF